MLAGFDKLFCKFCKEDVFHDCVVRVCPQCRKATSVGFSLETDRYRDLEIMYRDLEALYHEVARNKALEQEVV